MTIKIAQRLRPYCHIPGFACLIPGTFSVIRAFPTRIEIDDQDLPLPLSGPVKEFTLQQDLEKHCVFVFGRAKEGYFRLRIEGKDAGVSIAVEKGPLQSAHLETKSPFLPKAPFERLSLGSHKELEWDLVQRRSDLKDWIPVLFCLGQKLPLLSPQPLKGTGRLLEWPEDLTQGLTSFFKAAFSQLLVPRLFDDQYQGLAPVEDVSGHPAFLIQEGSRRLRALFFQQNERRLAFLPRLPSPLEAGRMVGLRAPGIGQIDFEWSKTWLRRVFIRPDTSGEVILELQKGIQSFRTQRKRQKATEPLLLTAGKPVLLDQFLR